MACNTNILFWLENNEGAKEVKWEGDICLFLDREKRNYRERCTNMYSILNNGCSLSALIFVPYMQINFIKLNYYNNCSYNNYIFTISVFTVSRTFRRWIDHDGARRFNLYVLHWDCMHVSMGQHAIILNTCMHGFHLKSRCMFKGE